VSRGAEVGGLITRDVYAPFLIAVAFSAALHLSFIYGIAPRPGVRARPIAPLAARLVPEPITRVPIDSGKRVAPAPPEHAAAAPLPIPVSISSPEAPLVSAAAMNGAEPIERREDSTLPKADLPFPIDLQWYEARDLDTYPRALAPIDPPYPAVAVADNARGTVVLLLSIDENGSVHEATVVSAEPAGYFEASALAAAHAARFEAGQKDGHNVRSKLIVKLRFAPQEHAAR